MRLRSSDSGAHDAGPVERAIRLHQRNLAEPYQALDPTTGAKEACRHLYAVGPHVAEGG